MWQAAGRPPGRPPARPPTYAAGFGDRSHDVTTTALIKALGEHIGKPLQLRVARPGDAVDTLTVVALVPLFLGLLVVLPVLGHATWHLYRRVIAPAPN